MSGKPARERVVRDLAAQVRQRGPDVEGVVAGALREAFDRGYAQAQRDHRAAERWVFEDATRDLEYNG